MRTGRELGDLRLLLSCAVIVPGVWALFLRWDGVVLLGGHDAYSFILQYRDFVRAGGDWHPLLYAPTVYGGSALHNALPIVLFYQAWAWLGLSPVLAYNLSSFSLQIIVAYLGVRASQDLVAQWRGEERRSPWLVDAAAIVLFAFAPYLGWRFGAGHQGLISGILVLFGATTLATAVHSNRLTSTTAAVSLLALVTGLSSPGQQIGFYSVLFGGPIALALLRPFNQGGGKRAAVSGLVALSAVALSLPRLLPMLRYATGPDASRSLDESQTTYSYVTANAADWIGSIPWDYSMFPTDRPHHFLHETNYAFGPVLALLLIVPWRKCRGAAGVALASALLVLALSTNFGPISDWMIAAVPPLGSFRVPGRAMVVLCAFLLMFVIAAVVYASPDSDAARESGRWANAAPMAIAVLGAFTLLAFGTIARELIVWGLALLLVALYWGARMLHEPSRRLLPYGRWLLLPLAIASILAFEQRLTPYAPRQAIEDVPGLMRAEALKEEPKLAAPLTRTVLDVRLDWFLNNTGWASDIETVAGYWVPPRRFQQLEAAARHGEFDPHNAHVGASPAHPGFGILRELYNIRFRLGQNDTGLEVTDLGVTVGSAWFSASATRVEDFTELVRVLEEGLVEETVRDTLWVVDDMDAPDADALRSIERRCAQSRVLGVERGSAAGEVVRVRYESNGRCPVTLSMNYLSQLSASVTGPDEARTPLSLFPGYGALTSAIVPEGAGTLSIMSVATRPWWHWALYLVGVLCFLLAGILESGWRRGARV
ncbi:MAG: hypothetical protein ACN4G0_10780 [Polyangiales bacterium]